MPVQRARDASDGADERDVGATGRDEAAADRDLAAGADERQDAQDYKFAALDRRAAVRDRREAASRDRTSAADDRAAAAPDRACSATDRVLATNQLRDATTALAAIINSSNDAVIARSLDGIITTWNDGATLVYGQSAAQMLGRSFEVIVPPDRLTEERERHARIAAGKAESGHRCMRLRSDGQLVEVVMSLSPVFDDAGVITGVASISRPTSETERNDARFASLLEAAPDAIVCIDAQGMIVTVNAQVTSMFGYERHELLGAQLEILLPEGSRSAHVGRRTEFLREPRTRRLGAERCLSGRRRDGSAFPVDVSLAPASAGDAAMVIAVVRDLTEQRLLEQAALENETRLRQLAESVDILFILRQLDPPAYLYVGPGCRHVLELDPEEFIAGTGWLIVHPLDRSRVDLGYRAAALAGLPAESEHRIVTPDGQVRWLRTVSRPVPNPHGPTERCVVTVENITERVEAAQALQAAETAARTANEAKNHFLSRMSHELRTPLNAVLGFSQLLQMQLVDTDHAESVGQILRGGRHLLNLIDDVLDIARIEAREISVSCEPVQANGLVAEALALMAPLAEAADVVLVGTAGLSECWVRADRLRLRQILLNLLSNAVKYNRAGGTVWVESQVGATEVAITVRDDGPGIAPDLQSRLFTPFDRLGAESGVIEGTGIGLALTRSLAELMHGSLEVDSAPGRGSRFTVNLPRAQDPVRGISASRTSRVPAEAAGVARARTFTLLYVEDNEPNVRLIESVLKLRTEWRLIHAGTSGLGIDLAQSHRPDLVLLDRHLPDGSGAEVLRAIKSRPDTSGVPVVILTADASTTQAQLWLAAGADRYLRKPLDVVEILALLDQTSDADGERT